jgi:uncharacterized protein YecE (DUF72 family)
MDIWIGTAGYSYTDWVGKFYPEGTRSNKMLAYYSRHFPLVELNFTFYRPPTAAMLTRLADQTPPGFQFIVKLPQSISHEQSLRDLASFREAVGALRLRHQLLGLLCQLPQATHHTRKAEKWLEKLAEELAGLGLAVEFRHRSWAHRKLVPWAEKAGLDLVSVDEPNLPSLFPSGLIQSSPRVYVRMHSRDAGNWYEGDRERYDFSFSDQALNEWIDALPHGGAEHALILFNNCYRSQAVLNAHRMRSLFERRAGELHVVEPVAESPPVQRSLFD